MREQQTVEYHHPLSMSKAARWHKCPGSVDATKGISDRPGAAAKFGTDVHDVLARALKSNFSNCSTLSDDERIVAAANAALAAVRSIVPRNAKLLIEEKVTLDQLRINAYEPISGTLDSGAWVPAGKLQIIDLKTGFKPVDAKNNLQLIGYGLGAANLLNEFELATIDTVELIIIQVNEQVGCEIKRWELTLEQLQSSKLAEYQSAVDRVENEPNLLVAGPHCTDTYCPAAANCPALKSWLQAGLDVKLDEIETGRKHLPNMEPTVEKLSSWLERADVLEDLVKQIKDLARTRALDGEVIPGYKLVRGYGHKKWIDVKEVIERAKKAGILERITTLMTPAAVAKATKGFEFDIEGLWEKPQTDYRLVEDKEEGVIFND